MPGQNASEIARAEQSITKMTHLDSSLLPSRRPRFFESRWPMTDADILQAGGELPEEVHRVKRNRDIQTGQWHKQGEQTATLYTVLDSEVTFLCLGYQRSPSRRTCHSCLFGWSRAQHEGIKSLLSRSAHFGPPDVLRSTCLRPARQPPLQCIRQHTVLATCAQTLSGSASL